MKHITATVLLAIAAPAMAGVSSPGKSPAPSVPAPAPWVTGSLSLTANSHFMSFGQDIWAAGNEFNDVLFNPSLDLNFDLGSGWGVNLNTWWDVNDNAPTSIGSSIQEIDVNVGLFYVSGNWRTSLAYQDWMYASQNERAAEFKLAYTGCYGLNPYLLLHGRIDDDISFDTGLVTVLGVTPSAKAGPVTFSFPFQVAADTSGYHGGEGGFSFASAGVTAGIPLSKYVGLNLGVIYYYTNDDVIPSNPESSTLTASAGISISF